MPFEFCMSHFEATSKPRLPLLKQVLSDELRAIAIAWRGSAASS